jgi:hypothetical protein
MPICLLLLLFVVVITVVPIMSLQQHVLNYLLTQDAYPFFTLRLIALSLHSFAFSSIPLAHYTLLRTIDNGNRLPVEDTAVWRPGCGTLPEPSPKPSLISDRSLHIPKSLYAKETVKESCRNSSVLRSDTCPKHPGYSGRPELHQGLSLSTILLG